MTTVPAASIEYEDLASILPDDFSDPDDTLAEIRAKFELVHGHDPGDDVDVEETSTGVWVRPAAPIASEDDRVIFFVHGGGFVTSPATSYAFYGANVARACGVPVFLAEYRLAPETPFPGPRDDVVAAYLGLTADIDPGRVAMMGDSCGAGMALSAMTVVRDRGDRGPGAFVSLCGWFDLEATGPSAVSPIGRDPFLDAAWLRRRGIDYVGPEHDPADPGASPLHADLRDLAPMLLHAGQVDRTRSDTERVAERVGAVGGSATLEVWPAMPHGFHGLAGVIPEADRALERVSAFLDRTLGAGSR